MRNFWIAIAFAAASRSAQAQRPSAISADEQAVRRFVEVFATALSSNDAAALDTLTARDYTFVNQSGVIQNKAVRFGPIRSGRAEISDGEV